MAFLLHLRGCLGREDVRSRAAVPMAHTESFYFLCTGVPPQMGKVNKLGEGRLQIICLSEMSTLSTWEKAIVNRHGWFLSSVCGF